MSEPRKGSKHDRVRPPTWRSFLVIISTTIAICVYLFVQAPPPLAATSRATGTIPIRAVFSMLELENDAARALWTEEIVTRGTQVGLRFDEAWRDQAIEAGPLPALFLRETAGNLERTSLRLRLFLGSPFPINAANQFTGEQSAHFATLEQTGAPQFFFEPATQQHSAMFADGAVVEACVTCHNEHKDSAKTDWKLHETMGATTWMYPDEVVTLDRAVEMIGALRSSIRGAYGAYLREVATFARQPTIGTLWPKDGFHLPSEDEFMRELARRSSSVTLGSLIDPKAAEAAATTTAAAPAPAPPVLAAQSRPAHDTLVIRSARSTKITVDQGRNRLMVTRLLPGGSTSLSARKPLRLQISDPEGVEVEYDGKRLDLPRMSESPSASDDLEIVLGSRDPEKS